VEHFRVPKITIRRCTGVLFGTPLSRYAMLYASRSAANNFDAKRTLSAREYAIFTPAQVLRNWCEQRPSNDHIECHG
jgi:hypothetical protein